MPFLVDEALPIGPEAGALTPSRREAFVTEMKGMWKRLLTG
jgi:hypothetical protein